MKKINTMLDLILMLSGVPGHTADELAQRLDVDIRTIYRYLDDLSKYGYAIEKTTKGARIQYRIASSPGGGGAAMRKMYFTAPEVDTMLGLATTLHPSDIKSGLVQKFALTSGKVAGGAHTCAFDGNPQRLRNLDNLFHAVSGQRVAILRGYASDDRVADVEVVPYAFGRNYGSVFAYEPSLGRCNVYNLSRIADVVVEGRQVSLPPEGKVPFTLDDFGMKMIAGLPAERVLLSMSLRCRNRLLDLHPGAMPRIRQDGRRWIYDGKVGDISGVGGFVAGMIADVVVLESDLLKRYLRRLFQKGMEILA